MDLIALRETVRELREMTAKQASNATGDLARTLHEAANSLAEAQDWVNRARSWEREAERGKHAVVRWCCSAGNCVACYCLPYGQRVRITQLDGLSREKAEQVARNWANYGAQVVED